MSKENITSEESTREKAKRLFFRAVRVGALAGISFVALKVGLSFL